MEHGYQEQTGQFGEQPQQYQSHQGGQSMGQPTGGQMGGQMGSQTGGQQMTGGQMGGHATGQHEMGAGATGGRTSQQPTGGQFEDYLTGDLRIALDDIDEAELVAEWCADLCIDHGPQMATCIRLCEDVADLASLAEKFIARESIFLPEVSRALIQAADECARECEQHPTEHCQETASVLHRLVDSMTRMLETTYGQGMRGQTQGRMQQGTQQPMSQF